jgi:hypothetical protein
LAVAEAAKQKQRARRKPFVFGKLFRFVLRDVLLSPWIVLLAAVLVLIQISLFTDTPTREHFFGVQYATTMLMGALVSLALFARAGRPETYAILARPVSRFSLTLVLLLVAWLLTVLAHLIGSAAVLVRFGPWLAPDRPVTAWLDAQTFLLGSVPAVLAALLVVSLVALLSHFVSNTGARLVILAFIALLVMAFDSRNFPIEDVRPFLEQLPPVIAPIAGALRYATTSEPDNTALYSLIALAAYALALFLLTLTVSSGRETVLD